MLFRRFCFFSALFCMLLILMSSGYQPSSAFSKAHLEKQKSLPFDHNKSRTHSIESSFRSRTATDRIPFNSNHNGSSDGLLGAGEYKSQYEIYSAPTITLHWEQNGTFLHLAINANISGYFAFGWPIKGKIGALMNEIDMIYVFVNQSGAYAIDSHATTRYGHEADADQTRVHSWAGAETSSGLFFEITLAMNSTDADDKPLEQGGTYEFWFVWHIDDDSYLTHSHMIDRLFYIDKEGDTDSDSDGLSDVDESLWGSNPSNNDTDGDGLLDGLEVLWELQNGSMENPIYFDPTKANTDDPDDGIDDPEEDYDNDGLTALQEVGTETHALLRDTDGDKLSDGDEVNTYSTDPLLSDTDSDNLSDGEEVRQERDPLEASINIPYASFHQGEVDGAVNAKEYRSKFIDINHTKIAIYWEHDGEFLYVALVSNTTGWLSFGWSKEPIVGLGTFQMNTMDLVIGRVMSGSLVEITDHHGTSNWTHAPDLDFTQIEKARGLDNGYTTTIEFSLRLRSSDTEQDVPLEPGMEYFFALAYGLHDELGLHGSVTRETVQFYIAVSEEETTSDEDKFNPLDPLDLIDQLDLMTAVFLVIAGLSGTAVVVLTLYFSKEIS